MARGDFLAEQAAKRNRQYTSNQRADVRDFARSGAGRTYHRMMDLQRQADPDLDALKSARRSWNRNFKSTPAGMAVAGASTPQGAMDRFRTTTEDFRQANKPAYNRMYPTSGLAMDYPEKGGLAGMLLSGAVGGLRKKITDFGKKGYEGITSALSGDSEEEKERYATETFGPHREGVPYGGPPPFSDVYEGPTPHEGMDPFPDIYRGRTPHKGLPPLDVYEGPRPHEGMSPFPDIYRGQTPHRGLPPLDVYEGPWPHDPYEEDTEELLINDPYDALREEEDYPEVPKVDVVDDITVTDLMPGKKPERSKGPITYKKRLEEWRRSQEPQVIPGYTTSYVDDFSDLPADTQEPTILPPYEGREFGLGQFMNEMPTSRKSDWEDYLAYVQQLGDMPGGHLEYDEWHDMMRRRR